MNRDERRGKAKNIKGRVKQGVGAVTGNKRLEGEGAAERLGGAAQEGVGKVRRHLEEEDETKR